MAAVAVYRSSPPESRRSVTGGFAALGVGPLHEYDGLGLSSVLGGAAMIALIRTALSFVASR